MNESLSVFRQPKLLVVFAYAPAGLGHLRVTEALRGGLPDDVTAHLFLSSEVSMQLMHRFTSLNIVAKHIFEWFQYGAQEKIATNIIRWVLRRDIKNVENRLITLFQQEITVPERMVIVATHFGLGWQIAAVRKRVEERTGMKITLVVQVTDDSPQQVWYIPGVDRIFVPSEQTKEHLLRFASANPKKASTIQVLPYPISPILGEINEHIADDRKQQLLPHESSTALHIVIPVSGAAVGTTFLLEFMTAFHARSQRTVFHVVVKKVFMTTLFLRSLYARSYVRVHASHSDRQIIQLYEEVYQETPVAIEVTKPSEQAFKALLTPRQRGGVILLFTQAVGRQEYDNLEFLSRHGLVPTKADQELLFALAHDKSTEHDVIEPLLQRAEAWRGLLLPLDPKEAGSMVHWCQEVGIFESMARYLKKRNIGTPNENEIDSTGVAQFWREVAKLISG